MTGSVTYNADDPAFNYYGRWDTRSTTAITINSGACVEFAYTGAGCTLAFDVAGFTFFPAVFVQADNGAICRTTLSSTVTTVAVTPAYAALPSGTPPDATVCSRYHLVRVWVAAHSLYATEAEHTQWTTLNGGVKFLGARVDGGTLLPLPYDDRQIEFLGDSITQGLRLRYTGTDYDTENQMPYANWTQLLANLLGLRPVVTGFGGQGMTTIGTCGAPTCTAAFPFVHDGAAYTPAVSPRIAVIYQGSNDNVPPEEFEGKYAEFLRTVTGAYPVTRVFAVCPHTRPQYAAAIRNAVAALGSARVHFLDYSTGVIPPEETCDGCHFNPGGAVRLALHLAQDIHAVCAQQTAMA